MANLLVNIITKYNGQGLHQAKSDFSDVTSMLTGAAGALGIGLGAKELADFAIESFKAAEQARVVSSAFENLSGSSNIAKANLAAMTSATRGLISETEQMKIANQLLGMNIVQTAGQLEDVVGVSRRLGKEFRGMGAEDAANEFAIMIANMSVARLDSFGISSGNVRKRIDELMKSTEGMTREQAFFQATMDEGRATMERLGPEVETTSDNVAQLAAAWQDFQVFLGQTVEESGLVGKFFKTLAGDLAILQNLLGDDTPEARIKALNVTLEKEEERLERLEARGSSAFVAWISGTDGVREHIASLKEEIGQLTAVQEESIAAGKREQEVLQAQIRAEEIAAENLAKREAAAKHFAEVQEQFARDVVDLQRETDRQLADLQDQYVDDSLKAEEDHAKKILDIREKAAKDEAKAAKKLQKDLSKVDTDLKKNILKQQADEDKSIQKFREQSAKEEKQASKRKQIDALADERLFQFELQQMAAEGDGNAIKAALERRAIEEQIAAEKAQVEEQTANQKKDEQIATMREQGQEARMQLQEQAAERKADLEERAREEAESRAERLAEQLADEDESYRERQAALKDALAKQTQAVKDSEEERIQEMARSLMEAEDLTSTELDKMVTLAGEFGPKFGEAFADGIAEGFGENFKIDEMLKKAGLGVQGDNSTDSGLPSAPGTNGAGTPARRPATTAGMPAFQGGGVVGRTGVALVHTGEEIANPTEGQAIIIDGHQFAVREAARLAAAINTVRQRDMQSLVDNLSELMN